MGCLFSEGVFSRSKQEGSLRKGKREEGKGDGEELPPVPDTCGK